MNDLLSIREGWEGQEEEEGNTKWHAKTLGSDKYFHYLDCSDRFTVVYIYKKRIKFSFKYV